MNKRLVSLMFAAGVIAYLFTIYSRISDKVHLYVGSQFLSFKVICSYMPIFIGVWLLRRYQKNWEILIATLLLFVSTQFLYADLNNMYFTKDGKYFLDYGLGVIASVIVLIYAVGKIFEDFTHIVTNKITSPIFAFLLILLISVGGYYSYLWKTFF
jgi:hypothetical protein